MVKPFCNSSVWDAVDLFDLLADDQQTGGGWSQALLTLNPIYVHVDDDPNSSYNIVHRVETSNKDKI